MKQIPLAIGAEAEHRFDNFVPGANAAALAHLVALAAPGAPVYLWGESGSGKTHLLAALARRFQDDGAKVCWYRAGSAEPLAAEDDWTLLVLDDCDRLDPAEQLAAFSAFVRAAANGAVVAAAGRVPPVDLPLREDLRTRLGWGHVFALQPLAEAEVRAALRREADRRGVFLSDEVMDHLLTRFPRDLKHLMSLLDRLDEFALARSRAVTVPLLKTMLAEESAPS